MVARKGRNAAERIVIFAHIDGLGYVQGRTAYSLYDCPPEMRSQIEKIFSTDEMFLQGEPWFQGDHAIFLMNSRPALALTSELIHKLMSEFVHTDKDTPEITSPEKVVRTALALRQLLMNI